MEKLNRAQKCSILGPQNLGSSGGPGPPSPPWIRTWCYTSSTIVRDCRDSELFGESGSSLFDSQRRNRLFSGAELPAIRFM